MTAVIRVQDRDEMQGDWQRNAIHAMQQYYGSL